MFKVEKLSIQKDQRHLFSDVSFVLPDTGFCSLWTKDKQEQEALSYVLSGIRPCTSGKFSCCNVTLDSTLDEKTCVLYRNQVVAHWFEDFFFIPQATLKQNIILEDVFSQEDVIAILEQWQLAGYIDEITENLSFKEQVCTYIARVMIRKYKVLLFYPDSTPYSKEELQIIYHVLKQCSKYMLVIVVGDQDCYPYADRKIEFEHGYILSDDIHEDYGLDTCTIEKKSDTLKLFSRSFPKLTKKYQWVYTLHALLLFVMLFCFSIAFVSSNMRVVDIEVAMLRKKDVNFFELEKIAVGNDGEYYDMLRQDLTQQDLSYLHDHIKGNFLPYYQPIDVDFANAYLEGIYKESEYPKSNQYPVIEVDYLKDLKKNDVYGRLPDQDDEVMIPTCLIATLFGKDVTEKDVLGKQIGWYGTLMKVVGIYHEDQINQKYPAFYVTPDFVSRHHLAKMKSVPDCKKRIVYGDTLKDIDGIHPTKSISRYYNGKRIVSNRSIQNDEVILNFATAVELGFPYEEVVKNNNFTYEQKLNQFLTFTKKWIGKEIKVQLYRIYDDPLNSIMEQYTVTIEGFLLPGMDLLEGLDPVGKPLLYLNEDLLAPILTKNVQLDKVYYENNNEEELKDALKWLYKDPEFDVAFDQTLLKLLVVDLQNLFTFFVLTGAFFLTLSYVLYSMVLKKTIDHLRVLNSVYYAYGYTKARISRAYQNYFRDRWIRQAVSMTLVNTCIILCYLHLIMRQLSIDFPWFIYLFLILIPMVITGGVTMILRYGFRIFLKKQDFFVDAYLGEL